MSIITSQKDPGIFVARKLSNGIPVFFRQSEQPFGLPNVACSVVVSVGGRDDPVGKEGAAHFFEHMPFRGTTNFPTQLELTHPIELNGGYVNAFTTDEATGYEVILPSNLLEDGVRRVADMLLHPLLKKDDIEIERNVILEELRNKLASVNFFARQELYKRLLGEHPLVNAVIGTEAALKSITRNDLRAFHAQYYNAKNIALFFAGQFDEQKLMALAEDYFGSMAPGSNPKRDTSVATHQPQGDREVALTPSKYNRSVMMMGRLLRPDGLKESLMNKLFRDMLTAGMNSPLYQEIRDKRGMAYGLSLYHSHYQDVGILIFSVSTQFSHMDEVQRLFWEEVNKILVNQTRFDEVKHMIKQSILHREFHAGSLVDYAIDMFIDYGRIVSVEEAISLLESLELKDVAGYIQPYLQSDQFVTIKVNCDKSENG